MTLPEEGKSKITKMAVDLVCSIVALVSMNGVIQLFLYPYLNKVMGADEFGTVLFLLSAVSIMGSTFGSAANYSRMITKTKRETTNGDYNTFLCIISVLCFGVSLVALLIIDRFSVVQYLCLTALMIISLFRYYGDVFFRIKLMYWGYLFYYLFISLGYIVGVLTYRYSKSWGIVMILGELFAVVFVGLIGDIFTRPFFKRSNMFKANLKSMITLSAADLMSAIILNADRIIIRVIIGGAEVTLFYTASIVGKMIALVTVPLNGVIIGYLSRYKGKLNVHKFLQIIVGTFIAGVVGTVVCTAVSYAFVYIMYRDIYEQAKPYFWIANAGQIFYFISNTLMVILLRFSDEKYQLYINILYSILFVVIVIPMTFVWQLWGIAAALLIVNVLKYIVVSAMGIYFAKKQ